MTSVPQRFLDTLLSDTFDNAHDPEHGGLRLSALLSTVLTYLEDAGVVNDPRPAYFRDEGSNFAAECHGYACDTEDDVLAIFYCIDATESTPLGDSAEIPTVGKEAVDRGFRRLESLVKRTIEGKLDNIEPSQAASELVTLVKECKEARRIIECHVIATGIVSERADVPPCVVPVTMIPEARFPAAGPPGAQRRAAQQRSPRAPGVGSPGSSAA